MSAHCCTSSGGGVMGCWSVIAVWVAKEFFNAFKLNLKLLSHMKRLTIMSFG
jgi:hypothetical protein